MVVTVLDPDQKRRQHCLSLGRDWAAAAAANGLTNVSFEEGDAQMYRFETAGFDRAFSRLGVMFFADPVAAFANIGHGLHTGGSLGFACWAPAADNVAQARTRHTRPRLADLPAVDPNAPGPNSLSRAAVLRAIFIDAGYTDLDLQLTWRERADRGNSSFGQGDGTRALDDGTRPRPTGGRT